MHLGDKALLDAADLVANETLRLMKAKREQTMNLVIAML